MIVLSKDLRIVIIGYICVVAIFFYLHPQVQCYHVLVEFQFSEVEPCHVTSETKQILSLSAVKLGHVTQLKQIRCSIVIHTFFCDCFLPVMLMDPILFQVAMYPQRPSEPECLHYMNHGFCMFKMKCKYHHPADQLSSKHVRIRHEVQ
jgi:hypothetical protein